MLKVKLFLAALIFSTVNAFGQLKTRVVVHSINGYNKYENLARQAAQLLEDVVNTPEFKEFVLKSKFKKTNGLNGQQIYDAIIKAREITMNNTSDNQIDLMLRTIDINGAEWDWKRDCDTNSDAGTIGIDGGKEGVMAICPQRLELWAIEEKVHELAGHYAHEFMHQLGFDHKRVMSTENWRKKTLVYQVGNFVSEMAKNLNRLNKP